MKEKSIKKNAALWVVIVLVLMGVSFYAGNKYGQGVAAAARTAMRGSFGGAGGQTARFGAGGSVVMGNVVSMDATSITLKMRDGSSRIVLYSGSTTVLKTAPDTMSDIAVGSQISVQGTQNTDGSVTAKTISIRPDMPAPTPSPATN